MIQKQKLNIYLAFEETLILAGFEPRTSETMDQSLASCF